MHRRVGDLFRLANDCQPLRRLQRLERVNIAVASKMTVLLLLNMGDEFRLRRGCWFGLRFEVGRKKRGALLIDNLAGSEVGARNRGEASANSFDQTRSDDVSDDFAVAS